MEEKITYRRPDGKECKAYYAIPAAGETAPGVVVLQEWWGLNDHIRHWAARLAADGYAALAVDLGPHGFVAGLQVADAGTVLAEVGESLLDDLVGTAVVTVFGGDAAALLHGADDEVGIAGLFGVAEGRAQPDLRVAIIALALTQNAISLPVVIGILMLMGVVLMGAAIFVLFLMPWLDRSKVKSIRYKGLWYKIMLGLFVIAFLRLGMLGMAEGTPAQTVEMRVWTFVYFAFFILLYFISPGAKTKPLPERVTH